MSTTPWVFPLGAPADPRRDYPVFSTLPNWKNGVTERLEWLTEVLSSEASVEQRRSLRRWPRRSFEASFLRAYNGRSRLDMFLAGIGKRQCLVPLWHEQFTLKTPFGSDGYVEFDPGTVSMSEWAVGDLVMITTGEDSVYAVLHVSAVSLPGNAITLNALTSVGAWPQGSRIIPLRVARVLDQATVESVADRVGASQVRFELSDADPRFTGSWNYCSPLWRIKPDRKVALKSDYSRSDYTLDFNAGVVAVTDVGNRVEVSQSMGLKFFSRTALWEFRQFLYNARGRLHRFYVPSFTSDIVPLGDIAGTEFDAEMNGFSEYMRDPQEARLIIGIYFDDGRPPLYRTITNIVPKLSSNAPFQQVGERFTLDKALPALNKRDIDKISFVAPSRFDQDAVEIQHYIAGCTAVSSSVVTRSVIAAGMPPLDCWVTSQPYPYQHFDEMQTDLIVIGGYFTGEPVNHAYSPQSDKLTTSFEHLGGALTSEVKSYENYAPENVESNVTLLSGILKTMLFNTTLQPVDAYESDAFVISAVISSRLIKYENYLPENVETDMIITGGTLS